MSFVAVGVGEIVWDMFPEGRRLGGAPVNFACHCRQLGAEAYPVSCVGADPLGREIRRVLSSLHVDPSYVVEDAAYPTGTVGVTLDGKGKPSYEIRQGVAWDILPMSGKLEELAQRTDAVCFGSLGQRSAVSRSTIQAFLVRMRPEALKIFDVNLRQRFYSKTIIEESLRLANILKLSDEELPVIERMFGLSGSVCERLAELVDLFNLQLIAYTCGANGSLLVTLDEINQHPGIFCDVVDSVGAGDSFAAALCMGLLNGETLAEINQHANRVATFVCSQSGATPELPAEIIKGEIYA